MSVAEFEQEPLFYQNITYMQILDGEKVGGMEPREYITVGHEEIQKLPDENLRCVLGKMSVNGQLEDDNMGAIMYALPIVNADGSLRIITRTPYKRRSSV